MLKILEPFWNGASLGPHAAPLMGYILVKGGNEIEGGKKPFMCADKKRFSKFFK